MAGSAVGLPPTGAPGKKVSINERVKSKAPVQEPVQGSVQAPDPDQQTPKTSKVIEKVDGKLVIRNKTAMSQVTPWQYRSRSTPLPRGLRYRSSPIL